MQSTVGEHFLPGAKEQKQLNSRHPATKAAQFTAKELALQSCRRLLMLGVARERERGG